MKHWWLAGVLALLLSKAGAQRREDSLRIEQRLATQTGPVASPRQAPHLSPEMNATPLERFRNASRAYHHAQLTQNTPALAEALYKIGKIFNGVADYATARYYFMECLRLREPRGPSIELARLYVQLAGNYGLTQERTIGLRYAHKSLETARRLNDPHSLMSGYNVIRSTYFDAALYQKDPRQVNLDTALYYARQSLRMALLLKKPRDIAAMYHGIGAIYRLKDPVRAIGYLEQSLHLYEGYGNAYNVIFGLVSLADGHLTLHHPRQALALLQQAARLYRKSGQHEPHLLSSLEHSFTQAYALQQDWPRAFAHQTRAHALRNEILSTQQQEALSRLTIQYETQQKQTQLIQQQYVLTTQQKALAQAHARQRLILWELVGALAGALLFFILFRRNRTLSRQNALLVAEQNHRVNNNLQMLSSLLNLQLKTLEEESARQALRNSLNRIQAVALLQRHLQEESDAVIFMPTYVEGLLEGLLDLYALADLETSVAIDSVKVPSQVALTLGLIINEVITNAFKHALLKTPEPRLSVTFTTHASHQFALHISDNGPGGIPQRKSGSLGLKLIDLLTRQLGGRSFFTSQSGTHFELTFPLIPL